MKQESFVDEEEAVFCGADSATSATRLAALEAQKDLAFSADLAENA